MNTKARVRSFWLTLILFALAACGGGGGGGGGGVGGGGPASPIADVSGTWTITEQGVSDCEGEETFSRGPYQVTVTQTGNNLTVVTPVGTFSGTINGDKVSWGGSYPEQGGGTTTINSMTLTVAADGNSFSGSSTWSWSDGTESCSGTTQATNGTRVPGTGPVPPVPTGLTATAQSSSAIALSWNPGVVAVAAEVDAPASGYKIERSLSPDSGFAQVGFVATNTTTYTDTGLNPITLYYYRVRAYNSSGDSAFSNVASAMTLSTPPDAIAKPSDLTATATSSSSVKLSWTDNSSNETGFKIERSTNATSGFVQIGTVGANVVSYTNTGLAGATTYHYRVRATNAAGDSPYSNTANVSTPPVITAPSPPSNLIASALSSSSIKLSWADNSSNETGFKIERSTSATSGFSQVGVVTANVTTFTNTGLSPSTTYYYRVRSTITSVIPALDSAYSNVASATTPTGSTTVTLYAAKDAQIMTSDADSRFGNTNYGNYASMLLGNDFEWGAFISIYSKAAILLDFSFDPSTWSGKRITSAKLRLYVYDYPIQATGRYVAYKIVDTLIGGNPQYPWSETSVTWNNAPPYALSPTSTAYPPTNPAEYTEWDVTSIVQGWFTSGTMGNGILIRDMNAPPSLSYTTNQFSNYYSRNYSVQALRPRLIITY